VLRTNRPWSGGLCDLRWGDDRCGAHAGRHCLGSDQETKVTARTMSTAQEQSISGRSLLPLGIERQAEPEQVDPVDGNGEEED
jgi:hypothetical protein